MSMTITPNGFNATTVGLQNVRIGWDGALNPVSDTVKLSLGFLPANTVLKIARGTLVKAEGSAGNLLLATSTDGGTTTTTKLTIDANGTAGTRTSAPSNIDAAAAVATAGCLVDTAAATNVELFLLGSAALDTAQAVIDLEVYFGPTIGDDGTAFLSL